MKWNGTSLLRLGQELFKEERPDRPDDDRGFDIKTGGTRRGTSMYDDEGRLRTDIFTTAPAPERKPRPRPGGYVPHEKAGRGFPVMKLEPDEAAPHLSVTGHASAPLSGPDQGKARPLWSPGDKRAGADAQPVDEESPARWTDPDRPMPAPKRLMGSTEYYAFRAGDFLRRNPGKVPPSYYMDYGDKYARRFTNETFPDLSDKGKAWLLSSRRKLQEKMEGMLQDPANAGLEHRADELRDRAFDQHSDAYLEAGLYDALLDLKKINSLDDLKNLKNIQIIWTPDAAEWTSKATWREAWETGEGLYSQSAADVKDMMSSAIQRMKKRKKQTIPDDQGR
jgi:hypothetical protein